MTCRRLTVALFCALLIGLAGCGKKADVQHPEGTEPTYPRTYPSR